MKLAAQGDLVAPGLRQQMRVGIASNVAQQRLMKDDLRCPRTASPARGIEAQNPANARSRGRSHRRVPSENPHVELTVPPLIPPGEHGRASIAP